MKFKQYLNEVTSGIDAWTKYFKDQDIATVVKKNGPIYDENGKKTDDTIEGGSEILVPSSSIFDKGKIKVLFNSKPIIITFANIRKPATTGGEQLSIQAAKLVQTAPVKTITIGNKKFPATVFYNSTELSNTLYSGIQMIKTIPDDLKNILLVYLSSGQYNLIDWGDYSNNQFKGEIAKYLGELMIGLTVMSGQKSLTGSNPFKHKITEFIVPTDSSFVGIDSMFKTIKGEIIPISSKSAKGAPASFYANVMPELIKDGMNIPNGILKFMVDIAKRNNFKNLEFLYNVGIGLMKKELNNHPLGKEILKNPYSLYTNVRTGKMGEKEDYLISVISDGKQWPVMKNMKNIISKLPNSLTYFLCQNIAELMNKDKKCLETITKTLGSKNFYQANLNLTKFKKTGIVEFKMVHSGGGTLKIMQGKGSMQSIKAEQGRLSYMIS